MRKYMIGEESYLNLREECLGLYNKTDRFQDIQQKVIDSNNGLLIVDFAFKVPGANFAMLEKALIKLKDYKCLDKFIQVLGSSYPNTVMKLMIRCGNAKYVKNLSSNLKLQVDRNKIYEWLRKNKYLKLAKEVQEDIDILGLTELNDHFNDFGKDDRYKKEYQKMLKSKNARYIYEFCTRVGGVNYNQVAKKLLEINSAEYIVKFTKAFHSIIDEELLNGLKQKLIKINDLNYIYEFAKNMKDAKHYMDNDDLEDIVLNSTDSKILYLYATNVSEGYLDEYAYRLVRLGDPEYIYKFARDNPTDAFVVMQNAIVELEDIKYIALFSQIEGANADWIENEVVMMNDPSKIYMYAKIAKQFNVEKLRNALLRIGDAKYLTMFEQLLKEQNQKVDKQQTFESLNDNMLKPMGGIIKGGKRIEFEENFSSWLDVTKDQLNPIIPEGRRFIMGLTEEEFNRHLFGVQRLAENEYKKNGRSEKFVKYEDEILSSRDSKEILNFLYAVDGCDVIKFQDALIKLGDANGIYNLIFMGKMGADLDKLRQALVDLKADDWVKKFDDKLEDLYHKGWFDRNKGLEK